MRNEGNPKCKKCGKLASEHTIINPETKHGFVL